MAIFPEERVRARRHLTERAIALAMARRWGDAAAANRELLALFPDDVDAHNRLGKALTELGRIEDARAAYSRAASLDSTNVIALKNLQRLSKLVRQTGSESPSRVDPSLFIEESGKTTITTLVHTAGTEVLAAMTAGDLLELRPTEHYVEVVLPAGQVVGRIEPKLGKRLLGLLEGGNRYQTAVTSVDDQTVKVIVREVYRSPQLSGKVSFPSKAPSEFRGYIKDSVLKYDLDDEEDLMEESEEGIEATGETEIGAEEVEVAEDSELPEE